METDVPISAVHSHYDEATGEFLLLIGDEKGEVKIQDISQIARHYNLKKINVIEEEGRKRNPHQKIVDSGLDYSGDDDATSEMDLNNYDVKPELDDKSIQEISRWEAHNDVIKSIQYIKDTDEPLIFTAGLDRMAKIWDLKDISNNGGVVEKAPRGVLIQGYMIK